MPDISAAGYRMMMYRGEQKRRPFFKVWYRSAKLTKYRTRCERSMRTRTRQTA